MAVKCILVGQIPNVLEGVTENVQTQLNSKQSTIMANGVLKGDGNGNISAVDDSFVVYEPITPIEATTTINADTLNGKTYNNIKDYVDKRALGSNLLINWDFGNPVNQRGQTRYPGGAYAIDQWLPSSGNTSLVVNDGFLTVTTRTAGAAVDQIQEFPYPPGTVLTLSALMRCTTANAGLQCKFGKDGTATDYSKTVTLTGTGDWELVTLPLTIPSGIGAVLQSPRFRGTAAGTTYDIKAIKLELGTQQTLAHQENGVWVLNEIPDHSEQYRRCLRYFQSIQGKNFPIFAGEVGATGRLYFTVPLIEPMRSGVTVADVVASDIYTTAGRAKLIDAPGYGVWAQHLNAVTIWTAKNSVKDYTTDAAIAGAGAVCSATLNLSAELSGA